MTQIKKELAKQPSLDQLENVKMIACDLDGTLLYSASKITDETKRVIRAVRKQGIPFGVCSGRPAEGLLKMLKAWGIEQDVDFILGFNGGVLYKDGVRKEWLKLPAKEIPAIMESFSGYRVQFAEYEGNQLLATGSNPIVHRMAERNQLTLRKVSHEELIRPTSKFMAIGMPWVISRYLKKAHRPQGCRMFRSGPFLIEIVHPRLSKLEGIQEVASLYGIKPEEVLSFGNDNNDLEMLAGTMGVAMENALPQVKEAAPFHTLSNRKDGVAHFLKKYLLKETADS